MTTATHEVLLERPIDEVFDFIADGRSNPLWQPIVASTTRSEHAIKVGDTFSQRVRHPLGYTVSADYRVVTYERPRLLALTVVSGGPIRPTITYALNSEGQGTRVRCTIEHHPRGVGRLAEPLLVLLYPLYAWEASWIERIPDLLSPAPTESA